MSSAGAPTKGKVYLGGTLLAERGQTGGVGWTEWKHDSPLTGKRGVSDAAGHYQEDGATLDPLGVDTGPPTLFYPPDGSRTSGGRWRWQGRWAITHMTPS